MLGRDVEFDQVRHNIPSKFLLVPNNKSQLALRNLTSPPPPPSKPEMPRVKETCSSHSDGSKIRGNYHIQRQSPPSTFAPGTTTLSRQTNQDTTNSAYHSHNASSNFLRPASAMSYTQQSSAYSMDDDGSSTTSGSYIISSDEVKLDGFLGVDVVV